MSSRLSFLQRGLRRVAHIRSLWNIPGIGHWQHWYLGRMLAHTWQPKMEAALAAGIGQEEIWLEPDGSLADGMAWIDTHIHNATMTAGSRHLLTVTVLHCTHEQWQSYTERPDAVCTTWYGNGEMWWRGGRLQIETALPRTHHGLMFLTTDTMAAFTASVTMTLEQINQY